MSDKPIIDIEKYLFNHNVREAMKGNPRFTGGESLGWQNVRLDVREPPVVSEKDVEHHRERQRYHHQMAKW